MPTNFEILLWFQSIREYCGETGVQIMNAISQYGLTYLIPIPIVIYWCFDKKIGQSIFLGYIGTYLCNHILKLTMCIERPWILDPRITPPEIALRNQGGYSFPSGHVAIAASNLGGALYYLKKRWATILGWIVIFVIGVSRCYLGVHTPLDVLVGMMEAFLIILLSEKVINWYWNDERKTALFSLGAIGFAILAALYFRFKPYPIHYDALGQVITDPNSMITYAGVSMVIGGAIGIWIESRFVKFTTDITWKQRILRLLFGGIAYLPLMLLESKLSALILHGELGSCVFNVFVAVYNMALFPALFPFIDKLGAKREGK